MFVSALIIRALLAELERAGYQVDQLCRQLDIPPPRSAALREDLPVRELDQLVQEAVLLTREPALGAMLGARTPHYALQGVAGAVRTAHSLREGCAVVTRYAPYLASALTLTLRETGELAFVECSFSCDSPKLRRFASEYTLLLARSVLAQAASGELPLAELRFAHGAPADSRSLALDCPVSFGQPRNGLAFARRLLDQRNRHADPLLHAAFSHAASQVLIERPLTQSFSSGVLRALRCEENLAHVDFARIASRWGITRRVLRYRLRREGSGFTELLNEARLRSARRELSQNGTSIKELADRFGYAETSSFQRAFKRWAGVSPGEYRRLAGDAAASSPSTAPETASAP